MTERHRPAPPRHVLGGAHHLLQRDLGVRAPHPGGASHDGAVQVDAEHAVPQPRGHDRGARGQREV